MKDIEGRTAIISGATQGLGLDIAHALHAAGVNVVMLGRDEPTGLAAAAAVGARALFVRTDIRSDADIEAAVGAALTRFGGIDILINNACIYVDRGLESTREEWLGTLDVNLVGGAILTQKVAPHLPDRHRRSPRAAQTYDSTRSTPEYFWTGNAIPKQKAPAKLGRGFRFLPDVPGRFRRPWAS